VNYVHPTSPWLDGWTTLAALFQRGGTIELVDSETVRINRISIQKLI